MAQRDAIAATEYAYTAVFEPAEEGGYVVSFPALPGCLTQGETLEEARQMAAEALQGYLEVLIARGRPIPQESLSPEPHREQVRVAVKAA